MLVYVLIESRNGNPNMISSVEILHLWGFATVGKGRELTKKYTE